jgi:hypothetical protein
MQAQSLTSMPTASRIIRRETLSDTLAAIKSMGFTTGQITILPGGSVQISIGEPDHKPAAPSPESLLAWHDAYIQATVDAYHIQATVDA